MKKGIVLVALVMAFVYSLTGKDIKTDATQTIEKTVNTIKETMAADDTTGEIIRVKDGDTYVVKINGTDTTVRLIGVDTPESVHSDPNRNTKWGKKVSKWVKKTLKKGTKVKLEYDKDPLDPYGRTLAYVYVDGKMFNKTLVKKGYARAVYYAPNGKYKKTFEKLQKKAKKAKKGFWKDGYKAAFP